QDPFGGSQPLLEQLERLPGIADESRQRRVRVGAVSRQRECPLGQRNAPLDVAGFEGFAGERLGLLQRRMGRTGAFPFGSARRIGPDRRSTGRAGSLLFWTT